MRAGGKIASTSPFPEPFVARVATGAMTNGAEQVVSDASGLGEVDSAAEALDRARKVFELMGDARGLELCRVPA
jgi:hypothetical protein